MRTKTFDSIVELLRDREWHTPDELATRTRYPDHWIAQLHRESLLDVEEHHGRTVVRLRADDTALAQHT
jgi:hypothetical protein